MAATALAVHSRALRAATSDHIVIVGAGIVGASIGYHLAQRGARVTILEKVRPASGATGDSFAFLNASTKQPRTYYNLNLLGIEGWRRLELELGGKLPIQWGGSVSWRADQKAAEKLLTSLHIYQQWGYAGRQVDELEIRRLLPTVESGPVSAGVFYPQEGTLDPVAAVDAVLAHAKTLGAEVHYPVDVTGVDITGDRVYGVRTSHGNVAADALVIAAGTGSQQLASLAGVNVPLVNSPGVLAHTAVQPRLLERVIFAPGSTVKQNPDGRIVSSSTYEGSNVTDSPDVQGRRILEEATKFLPQLREVAVGRVTVGHRVLPQDGFPILGLAPKYRNLYVAATHSGVTLAPIIGQLAALEILDGVEVDLLAPYRPARFAKTPSAS